MITKDTSLIGVFGGTWYDLYKLFVQQNPPGAPMDRAARLAKLYIKWGEAFTLRADIAWAQGPIHECNWLRFSGIAKPEWNNFAGIGITGPGAKQSFETEELGVIAHFAHLAWYVTPTHVNSYCSKKYDPRHFGSHRYNGDSSIGRLNGHWAVPGTTYAQSIAKIAERIFPSVDQVKPITELTQQVKDAIHIVSKYNWQYIAIHHTVSGQFWTTMDQIRAWHLARDFLREGYNFGVNGKGVVEVGRPLTMSGAHVKGWNTKAIGIALYGDFRTDVVTPEQKAAVLSLVAALTQEYNIPLSNILGHKEFPDQHTACPVINMDEFRKDCYDHICG